MSLDYIHSSDPAIRNIFEDIYGACPSFLNKDQNRDCSIALIYHYASTFDDETTRRANWTLTKLGVRA